MPFTNARKYKVLGLHFADDGEPVGDSRVLAERFGKQHFNVLQQVHRLNLILNSTIPDAQWFRAKTYTDRLNHPLPYYEVTEPGFDILFLGFTGELYHKIKILYVAAFHEMSRSLRQGGTTPGQLEAIYDKLAEIQEFRRGIRVYLSARVKHEHIDEVARQGRMCPCCRKVVIVHKGQIIEIGGKAAAEFDHFYHVGKAGLTNTWLICSKCHDELTHERVRRDERDAAFRHYQQLLGSRQLRLFR